MLHSGHKWGPFHCWVSEFCYFWVKDLKLRSPLDDIKKIFFAILEFWEFLFHKEEIFFKNYLRILTYLSLNSELSQNSETKCHHQRALTPTHSQQISTICPISAWHFAMSWFMNALNRVNCCITRYTGPAPFLTDSVKGWSRWKYP